MARDAEEFLREIGIPGRGRPGEPDEASGRPAGRGASPLADLDRLRGEAEELRQRFTVPPTEHVGRDESGGVRVTVDGDGRVSAVEIDRSWRSRVGEHGLSAAVLQAVTDATMRRLAAWSETVAGQEVVKGPSPVGEFPAGRTSGAPPDGAEARRTVEEVLSLLEDVESELDSLERRVGERACQRVVGRSPSNLVRVTVVGGGQVLDGDIQRRLLQRADERAIAGELLAAFRAAYERAASLKLDDLLGDGKLARLHSLGADPHTLLRRLGLGDRPTRR